MIKKIYPYLLGVGLLLLDQVIKWWVVNIHPLFVLKNPNIIFGMGPKLDLFFWITFFLILILALFTIERQKPKVKKDNADPFLKQILPISVMMAGVVSNLIDRIFRGAVIDYLRLPFYTKVSFNLADVFIIIGAIIYAFQVRQETKEINESKILRHK